MHVRAEDDDLLPENNIRETRIEINHSHHQQTFEQKLNDSLTVLRNADLKHKARYTPIPFGVLISMGSLFVIAFSIYRYNQSNHNPGTAIELVQRYNNNTGLLPRWIDQTWKDRINFTSADMNFTCGAEYPLTNVCFDLFNTLSKNATNCAVFAMNLCESGDSINLYNMYKVDGGECGNLYPLNRVCNFVSIIGYPLWTCSWSAANLCDEANGGVNFSLANPNSDMLMLVISACIIMFFVGMGISAATKCFRSRDRISNLDEDKRDQLREIGAKLMIDISDNQPITEIQSALKRRYQYVTACQQAFLDGFNTSQKDLQSHYRLFHGYLAPNGKQIQGDGDRACIKKIFEYANLPVLGDLKIGTDKPLFFSPADDYVSNNDESGSDENTPLLLQLKPRYS